MPSRQQVDPHPEPGQAAKRIRTGIVLFTTALVIVAAVVGNLPAFYWTRSDYRALNTFLQNLEAGKYGDAYARIDPEMQPRTDYPALIARQQNVHDRMGRLLGFRITQLHSGGAKGRRITTMRVTLRYARGPLDFDCILTQHHSGWYIWSFDQR